MATDATARIPEHIRRLLRDGMTGQVLLVTSSGVYLDFGEQILLLCDGRWGTVPIGLGLENPEAALKALRPIQGQRVLAEETCLIFPGGQLMLKPEPAFREAALPEPDGNRIRQAALEIAGLRKEQGMSMLVLPLVLGMDLPAGTNPWRDRGRSLLERLTDAICREDIPQIRFCTENLLGLGTGLTPSADDILLGMLYVFRRFSRCQTGIQALRQSIGDLCGSKTNRISAAYLQAILEGAPFGAMEQVLLGLCGEIPLQTHRMTRIGSNSGAEMLLGMLLALKLLGYRAAGTFEIA